MEDNLKDMLIRHKQEIAQLQFNCPHKFTRTSTSSFGSYNVCMNCGRRTRILNIIYGKGKTKLIGEIR